MEKFLPSHTFINFLNMWQFYSLLNSLSQYYITKNILSALRNHWKKSSFMKNPCQTDIPFFNNNIFECNIGEWHFYRIFRFLVRLNTFNKLSCLFLYLQFTDDENHLIFVSLTPAVNLYVNLMCYTRVIVFRYRKIAAEWQEFSAVFFLLDQRRTKKI